MYLSEVLPEKQDVLTRAFASPKVKPGTDTETIMRVVGDTVANLAKSELEYNLTIDLNDMMAVYELEYGSYNDLPAGDEGERARDGYSSHLDDKVETLFEPYVQHLSQDWLGRSTIATDLWLDGAIVALARSAAAEIWKQLTHGKTPAQILANAGIVADDIETFSTGDKTMTEALDLGGVMLKIKTHVGKDYDRLSVYDDLDMVCNEDDEILCNSAGERLGLNLADIGTLQIAALDYEDPASDLAAMLEDAKVPSKSATTKAARVERAAEKQAGTMDASVIDALKECGVSDTVMAEALGVSRSTYINYAKGKTAFVPTNDQTDLIRLEVVSRFNKLAAALASIDGTEAELAE